MRLFILLILPVATLAQEPKQGQATVGSTSVPYLFTPSPDGNKHPTLVVLPGGADSRAAYRQWTGAIPTGWTVLMPIVSGLSDGGAKAVEIILEQATSSAGIDRTRTYLAGAGTSSAEVFYTLARLPGVFAAGLAIEGNPAAAVNTNKLFAANTGNAPLLWVNPPEGLETVRGKLKDAEYQVEYGKDLNNQQIFEWLFKHENLATPLKVDCETHSPSFARCYWAEIVRFDPKKRNDVLPSTRVRPGTGAALDLGGFGYDPKAPGPGLLVAWLPDDYKGPLKLNDRLMSVGGREIANAHDYMEYIDTVPEAKQTAVLVQRGQDRIRLETKFILPVREQTLTARLQAEYLPDQKQVLLITRAVAEVKLNLPQTWEINDILWNGSDLNTGKTGCFLLVDKDGDASARPCQ